MTRLGERSYKPNLLVLTSYPLADPKHGGQIRGAQLVEHYSSLGWNAHNIAYVDYESPEQLGPNDKIFSDKKFHGLFEGIEVPYVNDLALSEYVGCDSVFLDFCSSLPMRIDIIHVEQPWLWALAERYRADVNGDCILVYGGQNIEAKLKIEVLSSLTDGHYSYLYDRVYTAIDALEKRAVGSADIVAGVSRSDIADMSAWNSRAQFVSAANGVRSFPVDARHLSLWQQKLAATPFLLYAASAHPPNFTGFNEIFGGSLACFPPNTRFVIVGSVCPHVEREASVGPYRTVNQSRLRLFQQVSDDDLAALKSLAVGFLLPVSYGGGTNLKTAEALYVGKPVIGTPAALRGFDDWVGFPSVSVGYNPSEIHKAIRQVFANPPVSEITEDKRDSLTWANCFTGLLQAVKGRMDGKSNGNLG